MLQILPLEATSYYKGTQGGRVLRYSDTMDMLCLRSKYLVKNWRAGFSKLTLNEPPLLCPKTEAANIVARWKNN